MVLLPLLHRRLGRPLFLPAHGRGAALPPALRKLLRRRAGIWDLPELPQIGGPLEAEGAVGASQHKAAMAMGVSRCWYGVNGATGMLQAALGHQQARPGRSAATQCPPQPDPGLSAGRSHSTAVRPAFRSIGDSRLLPMNHGSSQSCPRCRRGIHPSPQRCLFTPRIRVMRTIPNR